MFQEEPVGDCWPSDLEQEWGQQIAVQSNSSLQVLDGQTLYPANAVLWLVSEMANTDNFTIEISSYRLTGHAASLKYYITVNPHLSGHLRSQTDCPDNWISG